MNKLPLILALTNLGSAILVGALAVPMIRGRIKPNMFYGVRFRSSFESEEAWYAHNHYGGKRLFFWSVVLAVVGVMTYFVPPTAGPAVLLTLACAPLVYLVGCWETYRFTLRWSADRAA